MSTEQISQNSDQAVSSPVSQPLEFRGSAGEYFRIWIVNTLLSILTLGIYSAWAKVRTRRYFLGNTFLAGSSFDFHAEPIKILYGRLIMGVLFLAYFAGGRISLALPGVAGLLLLALFPWIIVRGMAFNLSNTSYRNLRFGFKHAYAESYATYGINYLLLLCTLGLAFPYAVFRHHSFRVSKSRFGTEPFRFEGAPARFWEIYVGAFFAALGTAAVAGLLTFGLVLVNKALAVLAVPLIYGAFFVSAAFIRARTYNEVAEKTSLGGVRFRGRLQAGELTWIYFSNVVACLLTLGLLIPWAAVRVARYKISRTEVLGSAEALESFVAAAGTRENAIADAAVDFWDIDLGF